MKKSIITLATAVACMFAFSACTPEEQAQLQDAVNNSGVLESIGSIYLVPTEVQNGSWASQNYPTVIVGDTIRFNSAMCDITKFEYEETTVEPGVLFVAGNIIGDTNLTINFPLMGINLRDSVHSDYNIGVATGNFSFINDLDENNWRYYLTHNDISFGNMMIIAFSEDDYYICYDGTIHIDAFSPNGQMVKGSLNQVKAFYVTKAQLMLLINLPEQQRDFLYNLLPHATFDGKLDCRRTSWVREVAEEIERQRTEENAE